LERTIEGRYYVLGPRRLLWLTRLSVVPRHGRVREKGGEKQDAEAANIEQVERVWNATLTVWVEGQTKGAKIGTGGHEKGAREKEMWTRRCSRFEVPGGKSIS
jgi:hypothetical protein